MWKSAFRNVSGLMAENDSLGTLAVPFTQRIVVLALVVQISFSPPIQAQCQYEVSQWIPDGPLCASNDPASFFTGSMDEQGNVGGALICFITPVAGFWINGSPMAEALGPIAGTSETNVSFLVDPDHIIGIAVPTGQPLDVAAYWEFGQGRLLGLPPGANTSKAYGINRQSQIVGEANNTSFGPNQALLWENDVTSVLALPIGPNSGANAINEHSQITGWMGISESINSNAYIYDDGQTTIIPFIPNGQSSSGFAINVHGNVVGAGTIEIPDGTLGRHAIYWDGNQVLDLGTLPDHKWSQALDINDLNEILVDSSFVGSNPNLRRAGYWRDGVLHDLNDLVITDLGGLIITGVGGINNKGWILAGTNAGAFILKPVGSSPGDIDNNCMVNVADLLLLLGEWGNTNSIADVNEDGIVNVLDLLELLADWG